MLDGGDTSGQTDGQDGDCDDPPDPTTKRSFLDKDFQTSPNLIQLKEGKRGCRRNGARQLTVSIYFANRGHEFC